MIQQSDGGMNIARTAAAHQAVRAGLRELRQVASDLVEGLQSRLALLQLLLVNAPRRKLPLPGPGGRPCVERTMQ